MVEQVVVSAGELRRVASALDSVRERLGGDATVVGRADLALPAGWDTDDALREFVSAMGERLAGLSRECGAAAEALRTAADAYENADTRAADRLRRGSWVRAW
jgi:hypothetical protein